LKGIEMTVRELLLLVLVGWTVIGAAGLVISLVRREREKVRKGLGWLVGIWVVYMGVLVGTSLLQPRRMVAMGQDQCNDEMCFAVMGVDEVPRYLGRTGVGDGSRLVRVTVRVTNRAKGKTESDRLIRAYLVDGKGRRWDESRGVNGNGLTAKVEAGGTMMSQPVFKVPGDATGLGLVFTHGRWQPGVLVIGDSDSLWHKRTVVLLGR
jgi:hypothetical protein